MESLSTLAELAPKVSEVVHELQKERGRSAVFIGSKGGANPAQALRSQRPETDRRLEALNQGLNGFDATAYGDTFVTKLRQSQAELEKLDGQRTAVSELRHTTPEMARYYTRTIAELLGLIETMKLLSEEAHIAKAIAGYLSFLEAKERAGLERAMGAGGFGAGAFSSTLHSRLINLIGQQQAFLATFESHATSDQQRFYRQELDGPVVAEVERLRKIAVESPFTDDLEGVSGGFWFAATTKRINLMKTVEDRLSADLLALAADLKQRAEADFFALAGMLVLMMAVLTTLGYMIARNISNPVSELVASIEAYNPGDRLTMPGADRGDELGRLARSLDIIATTGLESARLKAALESCQTNVMMANRSLEIVYLNANLKRLLKSIEPEIRKDLPHFSADRLVGSNIDSFHKNPAHQRGMLEKLQSPHSARIDLGGRKLLLAVSPVFGAMGERLGTVVEWQDRTAELAVLEEIDSVVQAAGEGDLSRRLNIGDKQGFEASLAQGINQLTSAVDEVTKDVSAMMEALAQGELTRKITGDYKGRFGDLKRNANETAQRLIEVVSQIRSATSEVDSAASEISTGTDDLARRTEQAAANVEATAASAEEMASTVKQNADNAKTASELAGSADKSAKTGGEVVEQAVSAMAEIDQSAQKITEIISVIDEIAFQTNLLALNASVEAARAGEAGKGFAVVAQEVRQLAQRSAQAADDIKTLIQKSNGQVKDGVELVNRAGQTLAEIVDSIGKVAVIVDDISTASQEQAAGVQEINTSITEMDEMTQHNSALVEESSAAARALSTEAGKLNQLMAFFSCEGSGAFNQRPKPAPKRAPRQETAAMSSMAGADQDGWEDF
ncbi:MAG: nitrate- and nitrite sensing domain-containing protein [Pseudomonadota bacterium]